jgi:hypothetical protein
MLELPRRSTQRSARQTASLTGEAVGTPRAVRLRNEVAKLLVDAGYQITAQRRLPNNLAVQLRLTTGQVVHIYDTGSVVVQGVGTASVKRALQRFFGANAARGERDALAHHAPDPMPSDQRPPLRPTRPDLPQRCTDANGCPIRLPGTDAVLAMGPPSPPPKIWDNPKTLRHMENRLRKLGYHIRSVNWFDGQWRIRLESGRTIYYQDDGKITLGPFERDFRLERRRLRSYLWGQWLHCYSCWPSNRSINDGRLRRSRRGARTPRCDDPWESPTETGWLEP